MAKKSAIVIVVPMSLSDRNVHRHQTFQKKENAVLQRHIPWEFPFYEVHRYSSVARNVSGLLTGDNTGSACYGTDDLPKQGMFWIIDKGEHSECSD